MKWFEEACLLLLQDDQVRQLRKVSMSMLTKAVTSKESLSRV